MTIALESMAVEMPEVAGHPNRVGFRGVLTTVDVPSQRAPSGARGHLVVLTRKAAENALPSLLGMALDYSPSLDRHDVRRKVGMITRAEVVGRNLELGGHLFARDFPEIVEEIAKSGRGGGYSAIDCSGFKRRHGGSMHAAVCPKQCGSRRDGYGVTGPLRAVAQQLLSFTAAWKKCPENRKGQAEAFGATISAEARLSSGAAGLGLSYEVTEVEVADTGARIWALAKVTFTGAAILRRDKAAYGETWIQLST